MGPTPKGPDKLSVHEYINTFPISRRNEVRRQIDLFKKKHGKYPKVNFHSLQVQLEDLTSRQRRLLREDVGICLMCKSGKHEHCPVIAGGTEKGTAFCTCQCGGETSLGAPGGFAKIPKKIRKEFRKFPQHEIDPLDQVF